MTFKTLISEDGINVSLGRVAFWLLLSFAAYFWFCKAITDFPPTLYSALTTIMLYNFGKKGVEVMANWLDLKKLAASVDAK